MASGRWLLRSSTDKDLVPPLSRWGGVAALLGGVAWMVVWGIYGAPPTAPAGQPRPGWESFNLSAGVAGVLLMRGLTGAYLSQVWKSGRLGRRGDAGVGLGGGNRSRPARASRRPKPRMAASLRRLVSMGKWHHLFAVATLRNGAPAGMTVARTGGAAGRRPCHTGVGEARACPRRSDRS